MKARIAALMSAAALLAGQAVAGDGLYDDLGGQAGVSAIVSDLVERLANDPRTASSFVDSDLSRLEEQLTDQVCELSGGPCAYEGLSMADAHLGHEVTEAQMNAMIEMLRAAMRERNIPFRTQNRLLARLAVYHRDVIDPA